MTAHKLNVAVLVGGPSVEHEVSLATGRVILNALDKNKYNITLVTLTKEKQWLFPHDNNPITTGRALEILQSELHIDIVVIAIHGTYGEDGTIQGLLEIAGIPYTGSGVLASALAMDKVRSNDLFTYHHLLIPEYLAITKIQWNSDRDTIISTINETVSFPCIVKPSECGSSVGIAIANNADSVTLAITKAFSYDSTVLVQRYITGDEVTCAVLDEGGNAKPIALPPTQIIPKQSTFFDYDAKYIPGASEEITPPRLPADVIQQIQDIALKTHSILGCSGMSRTDMIVRDDGIFVLETNTIPGMTQTSLYPQAAAAIGISFPELLDRIIQAGLHTDRI